MPLNGPMSASSKNESSVDKPLEKEEEEDLQEVLRKTFHSAIRSRFEFSIDLDTVGNKIKTKTCSRINLNSWAENIVGNQQVMRKTFHSANIFISNF